MIINPFTRQVLNANPKGCNQYSGSECSGLEVAHFSGIRTFPVKGRVKSLIEDPDFEDLMKRGVSGELVAFGRGRKGAFNDVTQPKMLPEHTKELVQLVRRHKVPIKVIGIKHGTATVSKSALKDPELGRFLQVVSKYSKGAVGKNDLTEEEHRLLGKWLGYPKRSTKEYLS